MRKCFMRILIIVFLVMPSASVFAEADGAKLQDPIGLEAWSLWRDIKQRTAEHYEAGNLEEAEKIAQKGLEIAHVLVAASLIDLVQVYGAQGKNQETDQIAEKVYDLAKQLYGRDHMVVQIIAEQLSYYFEHLGRDRKSDMWKKRAQSIN